MNRSSRRIAALALTLALTSLACLFVGCASRVAEREFYDHNQTTTSLRSMKDGNRIVDRGFQHPVEISEERLRRILSSLEVRIDGLLQEPEILPAIHPEIVPRVSRALSESLRAANSAEEVSLMSVRKSRRFGVFTERTLTSFVAYVKDDLLTISLSHIDWSLKNVRTSANNRKQLPKPQLGKEQMDFRLVHKPGYESMAKQAVAIPYLNAMWDVEAQAIGDLAGPEVSDEPDAAPAAAEAEGSSAEETTPSTDPDPDATPEPEP